MKLTEPQIERLKSLEVDGRLTPGAVLADARSPESPLHVLYDWDVERAAHRAWIARTREIIGAVVYHITTSMIDVKVPGYVRDPSLPSKIAGYRTLTSLQTDPEAAAEALRDELTRAAGTVHRARVIAVALGLQDRLDDLLTQITGLQTFITARVEAPAGSPAVEH
jgi:hypothetical protein